MGEEEFHLRSLQLIEKEKALAAIEEAAMIRVQRDSWRMLAQEQELVRLRERVTFLTKKCNSDRDEHIDWTIQLWKLLPKKPKAIRKRTALAAINEMIHARLAQFETWQNPTRSR